MIFTRAGHWSLSCTSHLYLHLVSGLSHPFIYAVPISRILYAWPSHHLHLIALIIFSKDTNYEIPHNAFFSITILLPVFGSNSLFSTHSHVRFVVLTSIIADVMSHSLLRMYQGYTQTCRLLHLQDIQDRDSYLE